MVEPKKSARRVARRTLGSPWLVGAFGVACLVGAVSHLTVGCNGYDPRDPFQHNAPDVDKALAKMDAGDFTSAEEVLGEYLGTGVCDRGKIGIPETVREKSDGSFDLGLILFYLGEKYGRVFGDEEKGDPDKADDPAELEKRSSEIDCAILILGAIANDPKVPLELRARAAYLEGNLEFMRRHYEEAVRLYDQALKLIPGVVEEAGGDGIGRDAAWNRAIALRRIEDKKDAGTDGGEDADGADGNDGADAQPDGGADGSDGGSGGPDAADGNSGADDGGDAGNDAGDAGDAGKDAGKDASDPNDKNEEPDAGEPDGGEPQSPDPQEPSQGQRDQNPEDTQQDQQQQEDRLLDKFDQTPTYQQQEAKRRGGRRTMEDK